MEKSKKTGLTINQLKNAIWQIKNGMVAIGGYPLEWYEEDLYLLTGNKKGYHEE